MYKLKNKEKESTKVNFNTTINRRVFELFKTKAKERGIPMSVLIEAFMRQYSKGEFYLMFTKDRRIDVDLDYSENRCSSADK